jgi:hypothetical protein
MLLVDVHVIVLVSLHNKNIVLCNVQLAKKCDFVPVAESIKSSFAVAKTPSLGNL